MQPDIYQQLAELTENQDFSSILERLTDPKTIRLVHAAQGMTTEVGEFTDVLKKWIFYGRPVDEVNLEEELGDAMWYVAEAANALGANLGKIMATNIEKLRARYPDKFTEFDAQNRNLVVEREILEGKKDADS
jgi:NTP pyrophosphatase (non-canonical NTP hydrolase)